MTYRWSGYRVSGWLSVLAIVGPFVWFSFGGPYPDLLLVPVVVSVLVAAMASLYHRYWPCPRCQKPFNSFNFSGIYLSCSGCGLKKYARDDADPRRGAVAIELLKTAAFVAGIVALIRLLPEGTIQTHVS
ncbi:hypothetical protein [Caulobacter sp. 17J65-9]|uniref:hypothetical protein n=1 Tax=Caulobacter sp. 17J65-9 TaxID=2709382 RepID=UPI0013C7C1F6|nr:hypothetical protein [Caulobacter sp. 17J65-9]NEX91893.1 hypothetical protein [Caulobacter sp. 17J65-9]